MLNRTPAHLTPHNRGPPRRPGPRRRRSSRSTNPGPRWLVGLQWPSSLLLPPPPEARRPGRRLADAAARASAAGPRRCTGPQAILSQKPPGLKAPASTSAVPDGTRNVPKRAPPAKCTRKRCSRLKTKLNLREHRQQGWRPLIAHLFYQLGFQHLLRNPSSPTLPNRKRGGRVCEVQQLLQEYALLSLRAARLRVSPTTHTQGNISDQSNFRITETVQRHHGTCNRCPRAFCKIVRTLMRFASNFAQMFGVAPRALPAALMANFGGCSESHPVLHARAAGAQCPTTCIAARKV